MDLLALSVYAEHHETHSATRTRRIDPGNSSYGGIILSPRKSWLLCEFFCIMKEQAAPRSKNILARASLPLGPVTFAWHVINIWDLFPLLGLRDLSNSANRFCWRFFRRLKLVLSICSNVWWVLRHFLIIIIIWHCTVQTKTQQHWQKRKRQWVLMDN